MAVLLVLSLVAAFLLLDFLLRKGTRRLQAMRDRARRKAILDVPVRLDFAFAARTLKRFEVPEPRARVLAVDDEPVVLDSLRRILVVEGYSVDTVEHGPEALFLVQRNDYDVVLTDLVMPDMDGAEVVKAVKHLRPDMDVAVVTGFGTIESAVETMQYGGSDYLQKPFTPAELTVFLDRLLIRREERLRRSRPPQVRLIAPGEEEAAPTPENIASRAGSSSPPAMPGSGSSPTAGSGSASTISSSRRRAPSGRSPCPGRGGWSRRGSPCSPSSGTDGNSASPRRWAAPWWKATPASGGTPGPSPRTPTPRAGCAGCSPPTWAPNSRPCASARRRSPGTPANSCASGPSRPTRRPWIGPTWSATSWGRCSHPRPSRQKPP